jgi:hypothetical protein
MIRITITPAAFEAIAATLPSSVGVEQKRAPKGDYFIWLDPRYVDRLRAMRGPGESYSDVTCGWRTTESLSALVESHNAQGARSLGSEFRSGGPVRPATTMLDGQFLAAGT